MARKLHTWKLKKREIQLGDRTIIMGVLNVTPDSFSDGGKYLDPDRAYARAMELEEQGADIIDIGAESTRPGAQPVPAAEELRRLVPVLKRLRDKLGIPISVDTYKAEVAERALELGVEIINDPSGFAFDPLLAKPLVQYDSGVIFNHMRGRPETWAALGPMPDVMGSIIKDLDASINRARHAGVDRLRIVIDPGIGFGKRREQNSEILARLDEMTRLELPLMVAASRKSFLAQPTERETQFASAAAVSAAILGGAHIVRVHDVAEMKIVAAVADEVLRATQRQADLASEAVSEKAARKGRSFSPRVESSSRPPVRPPLIRNIPPPQPAEHPPVPQSQEMQEPSSPEPVQSERQPPPSDRPIREGSRPFSARPAGPRREGPLREGSRPYTPRREGPPREGSRPSGPPRPFSPRREGPPREGGRSSGPPRPYGPRREGSSREGSPREGSRPSGPPRPFSPRREGPPREGGRSSGPPRPYGPRREGPPREGSRPFSPRREGPPREGSRPTGPRREGGPPREGSRPSGPPRPYGPRREGGPPREGSRPFSPRPGGGRPGSGPGGPKRFGSGPGSQRPGGGGRPSSGPRRDGPPRGGKPPRKFPPKPPRSE